MNRELRYERFAVMLFIHKASLLGLDPNTVVGELAQNSNDADLAEIFVKNEDLFTTFAKLRPDNLIPPKKENTTIPNNQENTETPNAESTATSSEGDTTTSSKGNTATANGENSTSANEENTEQPTSKAELVLLNKGEIVPVGEQNNEEALVPVGGQNSEESNSAPANEENGASASEESNSAPANEENGTSVSEEDGASVSSIVDIWVAAGVLPRSWYNKQNFYVPSVPPSLVDKPEASYFYAISGLSDINAEIIKRLLPDYLDARIAANEDGKTDALLITGMHALLEEKSTTPSEDSKRVLDDVLLRALLIDYKNIFE